jgi:molybdopterin/thiamine biosynthesis adenylyltransferase
MRLSVANVIIVGAGGSGSYLLPLLLKQMDRKIVLYDGDSYEERNLDRQLFDKRFVGVNKARALASTYGDRVIAKEEWFTPATSVRNNSLIFCCADNHVARKNILERCDRTLSFCAIAANEYQSGQALFYRPEWKGSRLDPRVRFPDILTDTSGDPTSCTGEAAEASPQLALYNSMSANIALWLVRTHLDQSFPKPDGEHMPVEITMNNFRFNTITAGAVASQE